MSMGSLDWTQQLVLDTVNGDLNMPTLKLAAAIFTGNGIGTELFFDVSGASVYAY